MKKVLLFLGVVSISSLFGNEIIQKQMFVGGTHFSFDNEILVVQSEKKDLVVPTQEELDKKSIELINEVCEKNQKAIDSGSVVNYVFIHKLKISLIRIDSCESYNGKKTKAKKAKK